MAERRMFSKLITNSDSFLEMPSSSQNLYFHLNMNADDDGFVDKVKSIMRMIGAKDDDLRVLIAKSFIIPFDTGIVVIRHWRINNYIRNDRYKETIYSDEKETLSIDKSGVYTSGIPNGYQMDTQVRLGKEYGCVLLTTTQYDKLISDYGDKNYIDKVIDRVDEQCKMTGNKYKWKDFNLVIRKVIRENWSIIKDLKIEKNNCGDVF